MNNFEARLIDLRNARAIFLNKLKEAINFKEEEEAWSAYRQTSEKLYEEMWE